MATVVKEPGTYFGQPVLDYVRPAQLVETIIDTGAGKATMPLGQLFVRGMLGGAFLAYGTSMAFFAIAQGMIPILAALLFPTGFVIINVLQADLATGYFAFVPIAFIHGRMSFGKMMSAFFWVYVANLVGSLVYVGLLWAALTTCGTTPDTTGISAVAIKTGVFKTTHYAPYGFAGFATAFIKGILCNWFVTLGVVLPYATRSVFGKAILTFIPIYMFFCMGWEHLIVNMFIIPTAMAFGAQITMYDWWIQNELPVTVGNFVGGFMFTGLAIGWTYFARTQPEETLSGLAGAR
ncbi:MAG: formate/nitrite transporter family protein [Candidatus Eremiobacteraeota bacterium]|nr:formate/nitrite transporter family protein [Candidatus Eremiobacteraeota bacterium]MBV8354472.1 formate/nitrite transporter family protein [Candidatus Eremiobacteraeota bacterium]